MRLFHYDNFAQTDTCTCSLYDQIVVHVGLFNITRHEKSTNNFCPGEVEFWSCLPFIFQASGVNLNTSGFRMPHTPSFLYTEIPLTRYERYSSWSHVWCSDIAVMEFIRVYSMPCHCSHEIDLEALFPPGPSRILSRFEAILSFAGRNFQHKSWRFN